MRRRTAKSRVLDVASKSRGTRGRSAGRALARARRHGRVGHSASPATDNDAAITVKNAHHAMMAAPRYEGSAMPLRRVRRPLALSNHPLTSGGGVSASAGQKLQVLSSASSTRQAAFSNASLWSSQPIQRSGLRGALWLGLLWVSALFGMGCDNDTGNRCARGDHCLEITEFAAAGQDAIADEDGDHPDWIEIQNVGTYPVQLGGLFLTDDARNPRKWELPGQLLAPGEFRVFFASEKVRRDHVDFTLRDAPSYLALVREDGATVESEYVSPPNQISGVTYGRAFVDGVATSTNLYFPSPTPGAPNGPGSDSLGAPVQFEPQSQAFEGNLEVELELGTDDESEIRYTLDGTTPTAESPLYEGELELDRTTTVRARSFSSGLAGPVSSATYFALAEDLRDFSSDLPIVITMAPEALDRGDLKAARFMLFEQGPEGRTLMTEAPTHTSNAGMRIRGSSSFYFDKQQYNLELRDEHGEDEAASLLGMPEESDWILHAPWSDKSLMRNHLVYSWYRDIGHYAARTRFVELFFAQPTEDTPLGERIGRAHYAGVYLLMEKIKRDDERVNITRLRPNDVEEPAVTGGYLVARDRTDEGDMGFFTPSGALIAFSEPNEENVSPAQFDYITNYFAEVEQTFGRDDWRDRYQDLVGIDDIIDHHLFTELTRNVDGLRLSTYFIKERGEPLTLGPIWDCNLCLGNAATFSAWKPAGFQHAPLGDEPAASWDCECGNQDTAMPRPVDQNTDCGEGCWVFWLEQLFEDPAFVARYRARWRELRQGPLSNEALLASLDAAREQLEESQGRNFERWDVLGRPLWGNTFVGGSWEDEVDYLRDWIVERTAWLDAQLAE